MRIKSGQPELARAAIHGTAWRYLAFFSGKLMVLVSTVLLARLLTKDDFGVVGYALTAINFLDVLADLGIGPAIIYYPSEKRTTYTAFWLNLLIGVSLFGLTYMLSPLLGDYFNDQRAVPVIRVLGLTFIIQAFGNIHEATLKKSLTFNRLFISDFLQSMVKGGISILFALLGYGAWSLIIGQLSGVFTNVILLWYLAAWRPQLQFIKERARALVRYGMHIVGVDLLGMLLLNVDYLLVGRYLGAEALGVYMLAFRLPDLLILQFARILSTVIFPIYTRMRDVPGSLAKGFTLTTRYVSLVTVPLGIGVALVAKPFVLVFLTEKWVDAIPVMQAISLYAMLLSLAYNAGSVYKAEGRPQVLTWLGIARLAMLYPALYWAVTVTGSITAVGWVQTLVALVGGALNMFVAAYLLRLSAGAILTALRPAFLAGGLMAIGVGGFLILGQDLEDWMQLVIAVMIGGVIYLGSLWLLQRDVILDARRTLQTAISRG